MLVMRSIRPTVAIAGLALFAAACGTSAASDTPPETMAQITATAAPETTAAPIVTVPPAPATGGTPTTRVPLPPPTTTPPLPTTTTTAAPPTFAYTVGPVTEETVSASWNEECPLHFEELSLLTLTYWNFYGKAVTGPLVINTSVVDDVINAFEGLFRIGFPIERLALVDEYDGDDKAAMRANVTSGFNCRYVDGTERWSNHAFGLAIDINPLINPWAREGNALPLEGTRHTNRENPLPGMINIGDGAVTVFAELGWTWGGVWQSADYMHFSQPGN